MKPNNLGKHLKPKMQPGHQTAVVRVTGPQEAVQKFKQEKTAEARGKLVEAVYAVPVDRFPPIHVKPPKS